ncbi:MAG: glycosyltransferase family 39 protein [Elusimicrobiota bacterium]
MGLVAVFALAVLVPFMGKAYHNDEPFFLAVGRHILIDPLHPFAFDFTWYGSPIAAARINTTPPVLLYMLAAAFKLTGGGEWGMRLAFLPLDLLAACALYLIAARFLRAPMLPTLIVIASPAYLINMNHLMPEKPAAAFGFCGLYALVRAVDERRWGVYWLSALLLGAAILSKYNAVLFLLPAAGYALHRQVATRRVLAHGALVFAPLACLAAFYFFCDRALIDRAWSVTAESAVSWWSSWPHKLRSFLSFAGGCGVVTAFWPYAAFRKGRAFWAALALSLVLFLPTFDLGPTVRWVDRLTGVVFSCGGLLALWRVFGVEARQGPGWALWAPWILSVVLIQLLFYWSVMSRMFLFILPPLIFAMAERLETLRSGARLEGFYRASLGGVLALSVCLALVDHRYAGAQKEFSETVAARYLSAGRKVWFSGYMGLQYYLERAGGRGLDASRGGWELAEPGDVVVVLKINSALQQPGRPRLVDVHRSVLDHPIPLRLMSGWTGEGGFYSNLSGFLPYSLSAEPLEEFSAVELR